MKKNNKELLFHIFEQMKKLDKKEITHEEAKAQASLAKQANNSMRYEIEKAALLLKLEQTNSKIEFTTVEEK
jgi:hypothetical protein